MAGSTYGWCCGVCAWNKPEWFSLIVCSFGVALGAAEDDDSDCGIPFVPPPVQAENSPNRFLPAINGMPDGDRIGSALGVDSGYFGICGGGCTVTPGVLLVAAGMPGVFPIV